MLESIVSDWQLTAQNVTNAPTLRRVERAGWRPESELGKTQAWSPSLGFHLHLLFSPLTLWVSSCPGAPAVWLQVTMPVTFSDLSHRPLPSPAYPICAALLRSGLVTGDK